MNLFYVIVCFMSVPHKFGVLSKSIETVPDLRLVMLYRAMAVMSTFLCVTVCPSLFMAHSVASHL